METLKNIFIDFQKNYILMFVPEINLIQNGIKHGEYCTTKRITNKCIVKLWTKQSNNTRLLHQCVKHFSEIYKKMYKFPE